jgi:hypothetical protein
MVKLTYYICMWLYKFYIVKQWKLPVRVEFDGLDMQMDGHEDDLGR